MKDNKQLFKTQEALMDAEPRPTNALKPNVKELPTGALPPAEYDKLDPYQRRRYLAQQRQLADQLEAEREKLLGHVEDLHDEDTKNRTWENNHRAIVFSIAQAVHNYGRMPTQNEIAADTNLSRKTVHKHMTEYQNHPLFGEHLQYFQFMGHRVMGSLLKLCTEGNVQAIKTYLDLMLKLPGSNLTMPQGNTFINNNQHNYMQVNNPVLNQQVIQELSPEQLKQIEAIIMNGKGKE